MNQENYSKIAEIIERHSYKTKSMGKAIHPFLIGVLAKYFKEEDSKCQWCGNSWKIGCCGWHGEREPFNKQQFFEDCGIKYTHNSSTTHNDTASSTSPDLKLKSTAHIDKEVK